MSAAELPGADEVQQDSQEPQKRGRGKWVQDYQVLLVKAVYDLAKAGVFKGNPSYQAVLTYYYFNLAIHNSEPRGFRHGYVMPGCTFPAAVAKATSHTPRTIHRANIWLHQHRLVNITDFGASIELGEWTDTESWRSLLDEQGLREAPELQTGPRRKRAKAAGQDDSQEIGPGTEEIGHDVSIDRTSGPNTEEPNRTSCPTYSSDLPSNNSDHDSVEPTKSAATPPGNNFEEEREEAAVRPVAAGAGAVAEEAKPRWYIDVKGTSYRRALGRARPRAGEVEFLGLEEELLEEYPVLAPDTEPGSRDDHEVSRPRKCSAERVSNEFWMGVSKDGNPYFTREPRKGAAMVTLDDQDTYQLLNLRGAKHLAFRQRLYKKYASASSSSGGSVTVTAYLEDLTVRDLVTKLAQEKTWGTDSVKRSLAAWARSGLSTEAVRQRLAEHLNTAVAG